MSANQQNILIHQLCADIGYCFEDLTSMVIDWDG